MSNKIRQIANKFNIDKAIGVSRFGNGLINNTYLVESKKSKYILQKLHPIFKPTVLVDTHNITEYLRDNKFITPLLVKTKDNELFFKNGKNDYWRMLTYIPGICHEIGINPKQAFSAGRLVGRFHNILSNFDYKFRHRIKNFHNSEARIKRLKQALKKFQNTEKYKNLADAASYVLQEYGKLNDGSTSIPNRIIHGDLKINNVRFNKNRAAICLLDLDTLGCHKIVADIAGAAKTWCNSSNEDDTNNQSFNLRVFENMLKGYLDTAKFITKNEIILIPEAIKRDVLVLAARFITDAFEEKYFRLNRGKYSNLYEQNKTKATAQLALYGDFLKKENQINKIIRGSI